MTVTLRLLTTQSSEMPRMTVKQVPLSGFEGRVQAWSSSHTTSILINKEENVSVVKKKKRK